MVAATPVQQWSNRMIEPAGWKEVITAVGTGAAVIVAAIVTLLNAGAIRTWLEQRGQRVLFAQAKFTEQLEQRDERISTLETQIMGLTAELRAIAIKLAEAETKAALYAERSEHQGSKILELDLSISQCRSENQELKATLNRRGGI